MNLNYVFYNLFKMKDLFNEQGYINITLLCKDGKKSFSNWYQNKNAKLFLKEASEYLNLPVQDLLIIKKGGNDKMNQNTWCHPVIATYISQWISVKFSFKVSNWIEEWKSQNNNKNIYINELKNIKSDNFNDYREKVIQKKLQTELGGLIEVETVDGFIDLLTDTEIIEIKKMKYWKHAIGQILVYSEYYKNHKKRIHLFDVDDSVEQLRNKIEKYDIKLTY